MTLSVFNDRDKLEQENKELKNKLEVLDLLEKKESKQIEMLLAQVEKMKCCGNCKNFYFDENKVKYKCRNKTVKNFKKDCNLSKWELAE